MLPRQGLELTALQFDLFALHNLAQHVQDANNAGSVGKVDANGVGTVVRFAWDSFAWDSFAWGSFA
jgi:hypothetical protein